MAVHINSGFASFCTFANRQLTIGILISIVNDSLAIDNQEPARPGQVYQEKLKVANQFLLKLKTRAKCFQWSRLTWQNINFQANLFHGQDRSLRHLVNRNRCIF